MKADRRAAPALTRPGRREPIEALLCTAAVLFALLHAGIATSAGAAHEGRLRDILSSVARTTLTDAPFVANKVSGLLAAPVESRGTLSVDASGGLDKHTTSPIDERLTITDEVMRIERPGKPVDEIRLAAEPALASYAQGLRAILGGDTAMLNEHFEVNLAGDTAAWTLTLLPRSARLQTALTRLILTGANGLIQSIETTDPAGDIETLTILLQPPAAPPAEPAR